VADIENRKDLMDNIINTVILLFFLALFLSFVSLTKDNFDRINSKLEVVRACVMEDETPECLKK
jgi:hypothetical protein